MYFLICFIEDAFRGWRDAASSPEGSDAMELAVMKAASQIAANPADPGIAESSVAAAPYNRDYFLREFQKRVGLHAAQVSGTKAHGARYAPARTRLIGRDAKPGELGYDDLIIFHSVVFRRTLTGFRCTACACCVRLAREGKLMEN